MQPTSLQFRLIKMFLTTAPPRGKKTQLEKPQHFIKLHPGRNCRRKMSCCCSCHCRWDHYKWAGGAEPFPPLAEVTHSAANFGSRCRSCSITPPCGLNFSTGIVRPKAVTPLNLITDQKGDMLIKTPYPCSHIYSWTPFCPFLHIGKGFYF